MKIEFLSMTGRHKGEEPLVVDTAETGPLSVVTGTGDGVKRIKESPMVPNFGHVGPKRFVTPADGDAYITALRTEFQSGYLWTRNVDDSTPQP